MRAQNNKNKPAFHSPQLNTHPSKLLYEKFYKLVERHKRLSANISGKHKHELIKLSKELDEMANLLQSISREYDD